MYFPNLFRNKVYTYSIRCQRLAWWLTVITGSCNISFYRFPVDQDRHRRWLAFVSLQNEDWEPGDSDRICSDHLNLKKKPYIPTNPGYVLSMQAPYNVFTCTLSDNLNKSRLYSNKRRIQSKHKNKMI